MFPEKIVKLIEKYQSDISDEVISINNDISDIVVQLKSFSSKISKKLYDLTISENIYEKEDELHDDSKILRTYIESIQLICMPDQINKNEITTTADLNESILKKNRTVFVLPDLFCPICHQKLIKHSKDYQAIENGLKIKKFEIWYRCPNHEGRIFSPDIDVVKFETKNTNVKFNFQYYNKITFHDVIVIFNVNKCANHNHEIEDVTCNLPVIMPNGEIKYQDVPIVHCKTCKRYIMLKSVYDKLAGVPLCIISDETKVTYRNEEEQFIYSDKGGSKLRQYGYNVNCNDKLTVEQRHTILLTQLLVKNLTKGEIYSVLDTNIQNGLKRKDSKKDWSNAVSKWESDRKYVEDVDLDLPHERINISRLILRYTVVKEKM